MIREIFADTGNAGKMLILLFLVTAFLFFSSLVGILALVPFLGTDVLKMLENPDYSNIELVNGMKLVQIINMIGGLLLPALLYIWIFTPETGPRRIFSKKTNFSVLLASVLLVVVSQAFISWLNDINHLLRLPEALSGVELWMKNAEKSGELVTTAFLKTTSITGFLVNVFMIAILPAFAEELLFRGVLAQHLKNWTGNIHIAVLISSLVFAAIHLQFYGFLPRFFLGAVLGYLFLGTGNIWLPVAAHFINNFLSVLVEFLHQRGVVQGDAESFGSVGTQYVLASVAAVAMLGYYIYRHHQMAKPA